MRFPDHRSLRPAGVALFALTFSVCGGDPKGGPTTPVPPTTPPATVPSGPPPATPLSASCARLGDGAAQYTCHDESSDFKETLLAAIETLKAERPDIFDGNQVLNVGAYIVGLIKILDRQGVCAGYDGEELLLKADNSVSDHFDVLTGTGGVRFAYYVGSCYPAAFPQPVAHFPVPPGCKLPPSREIACGRPEAQYADRIEAAIDQVQKDKPQLFDFTVHNPGGVWPKVLDMRAYHEAVVDLLTKQGFCAMYDGEEIQAKKTNDFTEHYDINYADQFIRTGPGSYRGACYPAAF